MVDRKSGFLCGGKTTSKTAADVSAVIEKSLSDKELRTITVDRGKELFWAGKLEKDLRTKVYFCLPHHPWEKGRNKNTNGLIRDFSQRCRALIKLPTRVCNFLWAARSRLIDVGGDSVTK